MQFNIAITVFNRCDVLKKSLLSLSKTVVEEKHNIYIFDDKSTEPQINQTIEQFIASTKDKFNVHVFRNDTTLGCDRNMLKAIRYAFSISKQEFVITTDSDVLYNINWLKFMKICHEEMTNNQQISAISLYDSKVHGVTKEYNEIFNIKPSIGGLCALLNKSVFENIATEESWDWDYVRITKAKNMLFLCIKRSLIQHIGDFGTHSPDGHLYDFSTTFIGEDTPI